LAPPRLCGLFFFFYCEDAKVFFCEKIGSVEYFSLKLFIAVV